MNPFKKCKLLLPTKFLKRALRILGKRLTSYHSINFDNRTIALYDTYCTVFDEYLHNVNGEIVECGFGRGRSFALLSYIAQVQDRQIYGFDSFSGFPKITNFDKSKRNPQVGEWSIRSEREARKFVDDLGYSSFASLRSHIFNSSCVNPIPKIPIAFLHIDLDLYEGYESALKLFYEQVVTGGVIFFDEYNAEAWPGATKAVDEFVTRFNLEIQECNGKTGLAKYFVIKN